MIELGIIAAFLLIRGIIKMVKAKESWNNRPWWGKMGILTTVITCLLAIGTFMTAMGMDWDRPVWAGDLLPIKVKQLKLEQRVYKKESELASKAISDKDMQLIYLRIEMDKVSKAGDTPPAWMVEKLGKLQAEIKAEGATKERADAAYKVASEEEMELITGKEE